MNVKRIQVTSNVLPKANNKTAGEVTGENAKREFQVFFVTRKVNSEGGDGDSGRRATALSFLF